MEEQRVQRRLAAILAADVVGYSRLIGADEEGTIARLRTLRRELIDPTIAAHSGRIVKTTGDGILIEFASVVDAVRCAVEVQRGAALRNVDVPADKRIEYRVGIHLGDVVVEGDDLLGDGVNVAARLEGIAEPGTIFLSGDAYRQVKGKIDLGVQDLGDQSLKNILEPVRVYRGSLHEVASKSASALTLPDKPSIAVLPFQNMSGDSEQEYFADGMVEDIITALSRIRWLFVIARNSTFTYKGQPIDVKRVGRELGVRYLLEGSVRKAGRRLRITAQLIEVGTRAHLWADHFDGSIEDVFDLQDNVAISVAGIIEPTLQAAETRRTAERPTSDLAAYDLYLRARSHIVAHEREGMTMALHLLERAVELDPNYGLALSLAALCRADLEVAGWIDGTETNRREGIELARRALRFAGDDPSVLNCAAYALGELGEDIGAAIALADRSLELNPSFASGWSNSGWLRLFAGDLDVAIKHFETGIRLNPRAPSGGALLGAGIAHFFARRFREAEATLLRSLQLMPGWVGPYRWLAACYAHMGRLDEARDVVRRLGGIAPCGRATAARYRNAEHRELYLAGLRLATDETS